MVRGERVVGGFQTAQQLIPHRNRGLEIKYFASVAVIRRWSTLMQVYVGICQCLLSLPDSVLGSSDAAFPTRIKPSVVFRCSCCQRAAALRAIVLSCILPLFERHQQVASHPPYTVGNLFLLCPIIFRRSRPSPMPSNKPP